MPRVAILTDSTAYLPQEYIERYAISVIPLKLMWQGKSYEDGIDMKAGKFYEMLAQSEDMPSTSQISVHEFEEAFNRLLNQDCHVLALPISTGISGSYQSAVQAKINLGDAPVEVVDTRLVSMALGFQVLAAARAAQEGASLAKCKEIAIKAYQHIGVHFIVDTLKYLHKGGRIGTAKHLIGTALNIKPVLRIHDGKIDLVESVRSRRKAIERLIQLTEQGIGGRSPVRLSVFHAGAEEAALELEKVVVEKFNPVESINSEVSPVVGAHTGPGTLSIAYMAGM